MVWGGAWQTAACYSVSVPLSIIFLVWVVLGGYVFWRWRLLFVSLVPRRVPIYVGYLLVAFPVVVVEEALTCGTFPHCLLITLPMFFLHLSAFYPLVRFVRLSVWTLIVLYGLWGSVHEFFISGKWDEFAQHGVLVLIIMLCLNTLIYSVISILPVTYVVMRNNRGGVK